MTMRPGGRIVLLMVAITSAGCDRVNRWPTAPSPAPNVPVTTTPVPPGSTGPQIIGTVFDTAFRSLSGVVVEVLTGPQAGTSTVTGPTGEFLLSGSFTSPTEIRMTSADHVVVRRVLGPSHTYYYLAAPAPPVNIAGEYRISFTAAGTCSGLPDQLQTRGYAATITQGAFASFPAGTAFDLTLSGAEILENPSIGVAGQAVGFKLFNDSYAYIVEQVAADVYVAITGSAGVARWPTDAFEISVPFEGWIEYLDAHPRSYRRPLVSCQSSDHRLVVTRR